MPSRILVVDDDPDIVDYFSALLEDHGYEVGSANGARTALSVVDTFKPDVVLIDVMMPGRSGLDLLVNLRQDPRWCDLPLVVITGNDHLLRDGCQSYLGSYDDMKGPDGMLGKPIDPDALLTVLSRITAKKTPV